MPEISRFLGIVVYRYHVDHPPPHFHVRLGDQEAMFAIDTLAVIEGQLPPRARGLIVEWAAQHQQELRTNWDLARRHLPVIRIAPLE